MMSLRHFHPSRVAFAGILCELRATKGVTQLQVAWAMGVSAGAVSLWEKGKRVPRSETTIRSLAQYLNAGERTDELLTAAGFGSKPAFTLDVVGRLAEFLQSPRVSNRSKIELSGLIGDLISVFELREMIFQDVLSDERPALQGLVRSLTKLPANKRAHVIATLGQLVESVLTETET